jgi:hypothetical protein
VTIGVNRQKWYGINIERERNRMKSGWKRKNIPVIQSIDFLEKTP